LPPIVWDVPIGTVYVGPGEYKFGQIPYPRVDDEPTVATRVNGDGDPEYYFSDKGEMKKCVFPYEVLLPSNSEFYDKFEEHEKTHWDQYVEDDEYYIPEPLFDLIKNQYFLDLNDLLALYSSQKQAYNLQCENIYKQPGNVAAREEEAWDACNVIDPDFLENHTY
jgi:hypothetical protein